MISLCRDESEGLAVWFETTSQPESVDKRKSFDNKKNAKIPHEAYEKKTSDDSESKLKVCQGCGKNHKLPLTYGQIKDKTKKELKTQNPKLTCHFLQHEDFNLTALPFDKTPAGKLFNKLDNNKIGLTWHLKYNAAQNKLVERPKVTKFTNNELEGVSVGDVVSFTPDSEYEFKINGDLVYRMYNRNICLKK